MRSVLPGISDEEILRRRAAASKKRARADQIGKKALAAARRRYARDTNADANVPVLVKSDPDYEPDLTLAQDALFRASYVEDPDVAAMRAALHAAADQLWDRSVWKTEDYTLDSCGRGGEPGCRVMRIYRRALGDPLANGRTFAAVTCPAHAPLANNLAALHDALAAQIRVTRDVRNKIEETTGTIPERYEWTGVVPDRHLTVWCEGSTAEQRAAILAWADGTILAGRLTLEV